MKYLKLVGLAAVVAMAVIGFGGAGSASATVLCKVTESPCSESNLIKKDGSLIDADLEGRSVTTLTSGYIFESCTGGTLATSVSSPGGASATVTLATSTTSWTWSGCEAGGVTVTQSGEIEIHHIAGTDNGTVTAKGFGFKYAGLAGECFYTPASPGELGLLTGGTTPILDINSVFRESKESLACIPTIVWKATYKFTQPAPFYVGAS
ncbi:MAG TPA: hypothetical protein VEP91_01200 [Solirubrobacterales bacterium]|nr:hypothetical protein [Solirubrobacterales bacterium]